MIIGFALDKNVLQIGLPPIGVLTQHKRTGPWSPPYFALTRSWLFAWVHIIHMVLTQHQRIGPWSHYSYGGQALLRQRAAPAAGPGAAPAACCSGSGSIWSQRWLIFFVTIWRKHTQNNDGSSDIQIYYPVLKYQPALTPNSHRNNIDPCE